MLIISNPQDLYTRGYKKKIKMNKKIICCIVILSAGTTDHPCEVTDNPTPSEAEIQFILKEIRNYLSPDVNGW